MADSHEENTQNIDATDTNENGSNGVEEADEVWSIFFLLNNHLFMFGCK